MSTQKVIIYIVAALVLAVLAYLIYAAAAYRGQPATEQNYNTPNPSEQASGGCYIGGCSSQICSDQPDAISTCEYRPEYACYQNQKCERQASGQCGWTMSAELQICLADAAGVELK